MTQAVIQQPFNSVADMVRAVVRHGSSRGAEFDRRLTMQATPTGMNESTPSEGGFLVDDQHSADVWEKAISTGQILQRCRKQSISTKSNKLRLPSVNETSRANGSRYGGMALAWLDEAATFPQSTLKFGDMTLIAKLLGGVVYVTNELLSDSPAFNTWFPIAAGREIAFVTEDAVISGTGAGQPHGLLSSNALIRVTPESGQAPSTLRAENCSKMASRLWAGSYDSVGTAWVTSNDGFFLLQSQQKADGTPLVEYEGGQRKIMGWPVIVSEAAKPLNTAGDLILCDFNEFIVTERDSGILGSIHLRFLSDESALRIKTRVDGQLGWSSPITSKNGGPTQSAAIVLDAR